MNRSTTIKALTATLLYCSLLTGCQSETNSSDVSTVSSTTASTSAAITSAAEIVSDETAQTEEITDDTDAEQTTAAHNIVTMESQSLGMTGISNARQLGGYITEDGMRIRDNILLRSGKLSDGTEEDILRLREVYNITEIIDLRTSAEISSAPDPDIDGVDNIQIKILDESNAEDSSNSAAVAIYANMGEDPAMAMLEMYRAGVLTDDMYTGTFDSEVSLAGYREFLDILLSHEEGALLWHCTGGKDRAGMAAVITLTLLGVDKETILRDFELTNAFNEAKINYMVAGATKHTDDQAELDGVAALVGVSRRLMEKVYELAESESGSMLEFLKDKLNITDEEITALRSKYLEPTT